MNERERDRDMKEGQSMFHKKLAKQKLDSMRIINPNAKIEDFMPKNEITTDLMENLDQVFSVKNKDFLVPKQDFSKDSLLQLAREDALSRFYSSDSGRMKLNQMRKVSDMMGKDEDKVLDNILDSITRNDMDYNDEELAEKIRLKWEINYIKAANQLIRTRTDMNEESLHNLIASIKELTQKEFEKELREKGLRY